MRTPDYQRGNIKLYLGDCRELLPKLDPGSVDAVVTDPPYGIDFVSGHRTVSHERIAGDSSFSLLRFACGICVPHSLYVFLRWDCLPEIPPPDSVVTWVKNNWSMGDLEHEHARQTEIIAFYRCKDHFFPCGRPTDVVYSARTGNDFHPTEKPIGLLEQIVRWTDGCVFDPFLGSGTTAVACVRLSRSCIGVEIEPKYFEIACKRVDAEFDRMALIDPTPPAVRQMDLINPTSPL